MFVNNFSYRRKITIDKTKVNGGADINGFIVLFTGTYSYLKTTANGGKVRHNSGYDIRFETAHGIKLDHELESYDPVTGAIVAWVKIPILYAAIDTNFYIYYGNGDITETEEDSAALWADYIAVYHLGENPASESYEDSTGNNNDGTGSGMDATNQVDGRVGKGANFDGSNDVIGITHNSILNQYPLAIMAYIKTTTADFPPGVINKYVPGSSNGFNLYMHTGKIRGWYFKDSSNYVYDGGDGLDGGLVNDDAYHQIVMKITSSGGEMLVDGVSKDTESWTGTPGAPTTTENLRIGQYPGTASPSTERFIGIIDEVRITRNTDLMGITRLLTEKENHTNPSTFYSVGDEVTKADYSIVICGVDRTTDVLNETPNVEDIINDQVNTLDLAIYDRSGNGIPETDDEIVITLPTGTKLFGGYVVKVSLDKFEGYVKATLHCTDYARLLNSNLVHKSYENMTDKAIIEDMIATYCPGLGITTTNVLEGVTIDQISFNYVEVSQALRRICDLTGRNWFIDYDKDIHYFPLVTTAAPFNITIDNNEYKNLQITKDSTQLKNRVYVRGGTKLSDFTTYIEIGDGEKRKYVLPDKPHDITVEVDTGSGYVAKSVGIKNVDTTGYDWYLNFQEKYLEQDSGGAVLTSAHKIKVTYKYDIPILVAVENTASIAENGVREFPIFDKTITTTQAARDRASAELTDYASDIVDGSFITHIDGFKSGQYININLTAYDVNANYIVQKVSARSMGAGKYEYTVSIASAKTLGIIRFLIELLEANKNLIELDDDEVVDELFNLSDSLLSDSLMDSLTTDSAGPYNTWAVAAELTPATTAKWDLFQWG